MPAPLQQLLAAAVSMAGGRPAQAAGAAAAPQWELVSSSAEPVIGPDQAMPHGILQGFETGQYMKVDSTYYYVATELGFCNHTRWDLTTRAGLWSAPNSSGPWTRVTTLRNTRSMYTICKNEAGKGCRNTICWAPTLVYAPSTANGSKSVWNFFYNAGENVKGEQGDVANPCPGPCPGDGIVHAVSTTDSMEGPFVELPSTVAGPGWNDSGVVVPHSHAFAAWKLRNGSYVGFRNNVPGAPSFSVGFITATADGGRTLGPWSYDNNSVPFPLGPENPVVASSTDKNWYYAVYDALEQPPAGADNSDAAGSLCTDKTRCDKIGLAWSPDGVTWTAEATTTLAVQVDGHHPCGQIRTPLGLVAEPELCRGCYSTLWTGYSTSPSPYPQGYEPVCHAIIRNVNE